MSESELEQRIGIYAKHRGCLYWKLSSPGNRGVPDRLIVAPNGQVGFLEIKAPGKKPTELQRKRLKDLRTRYVKQDWTDNYEHARRFIDELMGDHPGK